LGSYGSEYGTDFSGYSGPGLSFSDGEWGLDPPEDYQVHPGELELSGEIRSGRNIQTLDQASYVSVGLTGDDQTVLKSPPVSGGFLYNFPFDVGRVDQNSKVEIKVWQTGTGQDVEMGRAVVNVRRLEFGNVEEQAIQLRRPPVVVDALRGTKDWGVLSVVLNLHNP
jgi:hypothetical protein